MNDRTRAIIVKVAGQVGAPAAAISVLTFSGIENIALLILAATLAGAVGNQGLTYLAKGLLALEKRLTRGRIADGVISFYGFPLDAPEAAQAGGKGRALARLFQAGFPVPDGCLLLPTAFDGGELTPAAAQRLARQLARLRGGKAAAFAVRSSALQEDSASASFAGEFESVLNVFTDEDIRQAVRTVMASVRGERVRSYGRAHGLTLEDCPVAVVVQKMVQPDFAGVLFTADPLTGSQSRMVGNYVAGLGEQLVSGQVTPLDFTIERPGGVYHGPAELEKAARALHVQAHAIESEFGCPQDIEWAVVGERVYILQARPITTLNGFDPVEAVWNESLRGDFLWSATNLMEASPEVLTPFTASLRSYLDEHGGPRLAVWGYSQNGIIGGRFYANVSVQVSAFARLFKNDPRRAYREMSGWWGDIPEGVEIPLLPLTGQEWGQTVLPEMIRSSLQFTAYRRKAGRFVAENRTRCADLQEAARSAADKTALVAMWDRRIYPLYRDSLLYIVAASSDAQFRLERELRELVGAEDANALLSNLGGLTGPLESMGPSAGLARVAAGKMSRDAYVQAYGHRGVNEPEVAWPRPAEDPQWLERELRAWAQAPVDVDALLARQKASFDTAWERFRVRFPRRAAGMHRRIRQAAEAARRREAVRSEATRVIAVVRAFALRAGELLGLGEDVFLLTIDEVLQALRGAEDPELRGRIPGRRQALERYRALPPYPAFIRGRFDPCAWASDPRRRSDVFDATAAAGPHIAESEAGDGKVIHGFAGALGVVEGVVRRLDSWEDCGHFQTGEVLVTPSTNIGWTPLFPRAAAIVTDLGAPLSHAAIVARELGIPAVVGCGDATMRLKSGDRVRVDGGKGLVEVL